MLALRARARVEESCFQAWNTCRPIAETWNPLPSIALNVVENQNCDWGHPPRSGPQRKDRNTVKPLNYTKLDFRTIAYQKRTARKKNCSKKTLHLEGLRRSSAMDWPFWLDSPLCLAHGRSLSLKHPCRSWGLFFAKSESIAGYSPNPNPT